MKTDEFRAEAHRLADWIADYLEHADRYPVLAQVKPGDIAASLPPCAPEHGEPMAALLTDFERVLLPGITHWNHPGFMGYFAITASPPGVLAEFLSAALNAQGMLWRTSPSITELEAVALGWLRQLIGLPDTFEGVIYDTASVSTLHALAAAREAAVPEVRDAGMGGGACPRLAVYASEQAHSSVDKAVILLGLGKANLRKIPADGEFRMRPDLLASTIAADRQAGLLPIAVVATVGTTSTTSVDPVPAIADVCEREGVWLHVDAAYGGAAAVVPELRWVLAGAERADSLVMNPHKWLFTPFDLSAFYCRRMDVVRQAFSLVAEYLKTQEAGAVKNLMDTGIQLGRRFRSLKLWAVLRHYGAEAVRDRIRAHVALGQRLAAWVDADPDCERLAPTPLSVVCFRMRPRGCDWDESALERHNQRVLDLVNASGEVLLSHTKLGERFTLRVAIGHMDTTERHVRRAFDLVRAASARALAEPEPAAR